MKKFIYIVLGTVFVVGGIMLLKKDKATAPANPTNHTFGNTTSKVKLVEYADFQCPGCGSFFPILKQVKEKYKDQVTFQFVNFPLTTIHQNALAAHRAAQAASNQNKFWEMHDLLYQNQSNWSASGDAPSIFESYAKDLGLDMSMYQNDFISAQTNAVINADVQAGQKLKVTGTPTFFLNDKQIEDNNSISTVEKLSAVIEAEIAAKNKQ